MKQKGKRSLFVTLETNDKYENFNYMVNWSSYDVLLINKLMKTTFKLIYRLPMKKHTPICISVISITHGTDFLMFPHHFLPLLFHLHIQYLLLHHRLFGEKYIHIAYNVIITKNDYVAITSAFTKQLYNKNWTILHIFFKDASHRYRTVIFLNTSELLNTTCGQNH